MILFCALNVYWSDMPNLINPKASLSGVGLDVNSKNVFNVPVSFNAFSFALPINHLEPGTFDTSLSCHKTPNADLPPPAAPP